MRKPPELHLINLANNLINQMHLGEFFFSRVDEITYNPIMWVIYVSKACRFVPPLPFPDIEIFTKKMNPETLAGIIVLATVFGQETKYRKTPASMDFNFRNHNNPSEDIGKRILREVAEKVIIAAMFDILMTRLIIAKKLSAKYFPQVTTTYEPTPAMIEFVKKNHPT